MPSTPRLLSILSAALLAAASMGFAQQAGPSPVKIFILAGQSNMVGLGQVGSETTTPGTVRYLIANEPEYAFLGDGVGGFRVYDDVWIRERTNGGGQLTVGYGGGSPGSNIGPEMGFGEVVSGLYEEQILIIKTAWGNRDLDYDFRPPSSGPFTGQMRANDPGFAYREMLDIINDVTANLATYFPDYDDGGYEFAGFAWHQGWNDRIDATRSAAYETNMANFIRDVRNDLGAPGLPFVIATSSMDFNFQYTEVELAQLAMADAAKYPEFDGNVAVVDARQPYKGMEFWQFRNDSPSGDSIHWNQNAKTYSNLGLAMGDAISAMIPARGPYRLEATSDATGVTLTWSEGEETPTALQVLRNGVEIAASAPFDPPVFFDAGAEPGLIEYTLSFAMPGEPTPDLSLTFDAGITALEAYRFRNSVKLSWENNLDYTAIEVRRDGLLIEPALDGTATSYVDETPSASGTVVYSVVPTNGSASPTEVSINLDGLSPGNAYIYESFGDSDSILTENVVGAGLQGHWFGGLNVAPGSMSFGILPTSGNQSFNSGAASSAGAFLRPEFAEAGLLDDGAEIWFSFLTNNTASINTGLYLHLGTARSSFFGGMDDGGEAIGVHIASGTTPQAATWAPGRSTSSSSGSISGDTTALIVGKITWGADSSAPDTVEIYLPDSDLVLPSTPVSTRSAVLDQSTFNVLCFGGKNAGSPKIDEIRFATNYADVIATDQMVEDTTPPSPDPMTWETVPTAIGDSSITMTATTATDLNEVEYYFENVSGGGNNSGWQDSPTYVDTGLAAETEFSYRVRARDKTPALNTTGWSPAASATTDPVDNGAPPTPGFAVAPVATSPTEITMTAESVIDPEGSAVEYYFTETSGNPGGNDSGWQDSTTYADGGLNPSTSYSYTVTARDKSAQQNQSTPSAVFFATTQDIPTGPGGAFVYEPFDQTPIGADLDTTMGAGIGLAGNWSNAGVDYIMRSGSLTFGTLATAGNSIMTDANGGADVAYNT
ncbi:MAG TPA: sialate O-acetylesterase, partial [Luteolibacter sp.]|nr:sialate O-acetylesterase [Luteolibacter sp.]